MGECANECVEDECFCPFLVVSFIQNNPQAEGVKVHKPPLGNLDKKKCEPPNQDTGIIN